MKIKSIWLLIIAATLTVGSISAASKIKHKRTTEEIVKFLSADNCEGRNPGSMGLEKATKFVEDHCADIGLEPLFNNSFRDTLDVKGRESYNIVGVINSKKKSDRYIMIGAHLDHIGKIKLQTPGDSINNGANDNASGVTAVLQMAEELVKHKFNKNVIIVLFTGEESGLVGSRHLATRLKNENIDLEYMINFEMIGVALSRSPGQIYMTGEKRSNFFEEANKLLDEQLIVHDQITDKIPLFRMADNYPFFQIMNIPAHTFCTYDFENFAYYHKPQDEFNLLDIEHMDLIIEKMTKMVIELLKNDIEIKLNTIE